MKKLFITIVIVFSGLGITDRAFAESSELFKAKNIRGKVTKVNVVLSLKTRTQGELGADRRVFEQHPICVTDLPGLDR